MRQTIVTEVSQIKVAHGERYELCESIHAEQNALLSCSRDDAKSATLYLYGYDCVEEKQINAEPWLIE